MRKFRHFAQAVQEIHAYRDGCPAEELQASRPLPHFINAFAERGHCAADAAGVFPGYNGAYHQPGHPAGAQRPNFVRRTARCVGTTMGSRLRRAKCL